MRLELPHVTLIVLRTAATLALSAVIGQAGWAAAFLGGESQYRAAHEVGAVVTLVTLVVTVVLYLVLRRYAGTVSTVLAVVLAVMGAAQYALGEGGIVSEHIFLGVLTAMVATALTSWTFRHRYEPARD